MEVAVCISGQIRTFADVFSYLRKVFETDPSVNVFYCITLSVDPGKEDRCRERLDRFLQSVPGKRVRVYEQESFLGTVQAVSGVCGKLNQVFGIVEAYNLLQEEESERGRTFDFTYWLRSDLVIVDFQNRSPFRIDYKPLEGDVQNKLVFLCEPTLSDLFISDYMFGGTSKVCRDFSKKLFQVFLEQVYTSLTGPARFEGREGHIEGPEILWGRAAARTLIGGGTVEMWTPDKMQGAFPAQENLCVYRRVLKKAGILPETELFFRTVKEYRDEEPEDEMLKHLTYSRIVKLKE